MKQLGAYRVLLVVCAIASVAACATDPIAPPQAMTGPTVALDAFATGLSKPPVSVGDVFVYNNPVERREVIAVGQHFIDYIYGPESYAKTTWSPILPRLRWTAPMSAGNARLTKVSGQLHPLSKGNRIVFIEEAMRSRPGKATRNTWECEVQEKIEITVAAGSSDTWQILCEIDGRERVLYNYDEDIGAVVRMIYALEGGQQVVRQLTGYASGSPPSETDN
jgi:hypothetical protein